MHKDIYKLDNKEDTIGQAVLYSAFSEYVLSVDVFPTLHECFYL